MEFFERRRSHRLGNDLEQQHLSRDQPCWAECEVEPNKVIVFRSHTLLIQSDPVRTGQAATKAAQEVKQAAEKVA